MWQDVIVTKRGHNGDMRIITIPAKGLLESLCYPSVHAKHLIGVSRNPLIAVVPSRVARPDHKIDIVLDIFFDPFKGGIYEGVRRITVGILSAVDASRALAAVAGLIRRGVKLVEGVWMEV